MRKIIIVMSLLLLGCIDEKTRLISVQRIQEVIALCEHNQGAKHISVDVTVVEADRIRYVQCNNDAVFITVKGDQQP